MLRNTLIILCFLFVCSTSALAQRTEDQARDDLRYGSDRRQTQDTYGSDLWYGGGLTLGFQGGNGFSWFRGGLSPIVGYKLTNFLSVGPRLSVVYNSLRDDFARLDENYIDWSAGVFTRAVLFRGIFVQAEYSLLSEIDFFTGDRRRTTTGAPFLGAGFSQGGGPGMMGFETLVLFRLTQRERLNDAPFEIRAGFNYNF